MRTRQALNATRAVAVSLGVTAAALAGPAFAADVEIRQTDGATAVAEGGATDAYFVRLSSPPKFDVTVSFTPDSGEVIASPASVTFRGNASDNPAAVPYDAEQEITVSAVNDKTPDGVTCAAISHSLVTADDEYRDLRPRSVPVTVTDNDRGDILVRAAGEALGSCLVHQLHHVAVQEGALPRSYTLALSQQPAAPVSVTIVSDRESGGQSREIAVNPATIEFTPQDWRPQTVTVAALDDERVDHTSAGLDMLQHRVASTDSAFNLIPIDDVEVTIGDDDVPGLAIDETGGSTNVVEGGPCDTYWVRLTRQPLVGVTVAIASRETRVLAEPPNLTFTAADYARPQTVCVRAIDDAEDSSLNPQDALTSITNQGEWEDTGATIEGTVPVVVTDNDLPGLALIESGGSSDVTEGGATDFYTLSLTTRPASEVTVVIEAGRQLVASPSVVTFTAANYREPQTITLTAADDLVIESYRFEAVAHTVRTDDPRYGAVTGRAFTVGVTDNDARGVALAESGGSTRVTEGGASDRYTLALTAQPDANVTIDITAGEGLSVRPAQLVFTAADFHLPQGITVSAPDADDRAEGTRLIAVTHRATSADGGYHGFAIAPVTVTRIDNDHAGIAIDETGGATELAESGGTDTYAFVLTSQPLAEVTVTVHAGSQLTAEPATLTFTPADYKKPQTVMVAAIDDRVAEGLHAATLRHRVASTDPDYDAIVVADLVATIADNDRAGVALEETGGGTAVGEDGTTDTYRITLLSQPLADVTLTVDAGNELAAEPATLTFTASDWQQPRTIVLAAVDDAAIQGSRTARVTHAVTSLDSVYDGIAVDDVAVTIADNDVAPQSGGGGGGSLSWQTLLLLLTLSPLAILRKDRG